MIKSSVFLKDSLTLAGGTFAAQLIGIALIPALSRIYEPAQFGVFAIYMSLFSIISSLATGRYAFAVMLPREDQDAFTLVKACFIIAACFSLGFIIFIPLLGHGLSSLVSVSGSNRVWLWLLPLGIFLGAALQTLTLWNNRLRQFKDVSLSRIWQVGSMGVLQLGLGISGFSAIGLIWGQVAGLVLSVLYLARKPFNPDFLSRNKAVWSDYIHQIKKYKNFAIYTTWGGLLDSTSVQLTPILIALFFSESDVGFFAMTTRIIYAPIGLIGRSLSNVFFQRASKIRGEGKDISLLITAILSKQILASGAMALILFIWGPFLFSFVFGPKWGAAGEFARIISPLFFFMFLVSPITPTLLVLEKQKLLTAIQAILFITSVFPLILGGLFLKDTHNTLMLYSAAQSAAYIFYLLAVCHSAGVSFPRRVK